MFYFKHFGLLVVIIAHLRRQCYQYVAFASCEETGQVIKELANLEFNSSRDTGRLIVSHCFVIVFVTSSVPCVIKRLCFVGFRCPCPTYFEGHWAKTVHCTRNQIVHKSVEWGASGP